MRSLTIYTHHYYLDDEIKKDKMGGVSSTHETWKMFTKA